MDGRTWNDMGRKGFDKKQNNFGVEKKAGRTTPTRMVKLTQKFIL